MIDPGQFANAVDSSLSSWFAKRATNKAEVALQCTTPVLQSQTVGTGFKPLIPADLSPHGSSHWHLANEPDTQTQQAPLSYL